MNTVVLIGRLTRDPDVRYTPDQRAVARFSIAVSRGRDKDGNERTDYPSIVAFGKQAEFVERYFNKGKLIGITGRLQTGSYTDKNGNTVYTTDVVAERVEFVGPKEGNAEPYRGGESASAQGAAPEVPGGFQSLDDEDIPF